MAKPKLSDDEKNKIKAEKENKVQQFKNNNYINKLPDSLILGFQNTLNKSYPDLEEYNAVELLFKKFVSGDFQFDVRKEYY